MLLEAVMATATLTLEVLDCGSVGVEVGAGACAGGGGKGIWKAGAGEEGTCTWMFLVDCAWAAEVAAEMRERRRREEGISLVAMDEEREREEGEKGRWLLRGFGWGKATWFINAVRMTASTDVKWSVWLGHGKWKLLGRLITRAELGIF